jgi:1-deoxy-D-xylulose 5-phosphate reductoisomerase
MKRVIIQGATGSVGQSVLTVIRRHPEEFSVVGLIARQGGEKLAALSREFPRAAVAFHEANDNVEFRRLLGPDEAAGRKILIGADAGLRLTDDVIADVCVAAVSGTAGLDMAFAAARRGLRILLADKEVLVSAGRLFKEAAQEGNAEILPLDSEHSALFQCLEGRDKKTISKLILTASGGPFRKWTPEQIAKATPEDALRHPVWAMGAKITVDSASMANKALEVIEAHHLFDIPFENIDIVIHPGSIVHGLVEFTDGSVLAQMGEADMSYPASYALFYPNREKTCPKRLDLAKIGQLNFEAADYTRFPMLRLGIEAGKRGEIASAVFNAANEKAVDLFLNNEISFGDIPKAVETALTLVDADAFVSTKDVKATHNVAAHIVQRWADNDLPAY